MISGLALAIGEGDGFATGVAFLRNGPCGGRSFAVIPPPAQGMALRPNEAARARPWKYGAIAQLGERFNGIEEVVGSIPSGSTIIN